MPNESPKRWNGVGVVIIAAIVLPVLYVLSIGPAAWLMTNDCIESETLVDVYYPVAAVAYKSEALGEMVDSYVERWGGKGPMLLLRIWIDDAYSIHASPTIETTGPECSF